MKIKSDFVTNSSSTCYIGAVYKVEDIFKLKEYLIRTFGDCGSKISNNFITDLTGVLEEFHVDEYEKEPKSDFFQFNDGGITVEEMNEKLRDGYSYLAIDRASSNEAPDIEPVIIYNIEKPEEAGLKLIDKHCYVGMEF